ncbi:MAG: endolytic transglycosylase MltG [Candidatus Margulisiibacteriota bacterium]
MFRKILWIGVIVLILTSFFTYRGYKNAVYQAVDPQDQTDISIQIKKGETAREIGQSLKEKGLIKSDFYFYAYTKFHDLSGSLLRGRFALKKSMTVPEMITILSDPSKAESILTIQEGLTIREIDQKLVDLGLIESGEFIKEVKIFKGWEYYDFLDKDTLSKLDLPLEGYLYPDTYFLDSADFKNHDVIYLALDNFEKKFSPYQKEIKRHSVHEIITMASIIEREVFGKENREIVSGILWKRLDSGWKLDADATLLYTKTDREITAADLNADSPYNTRRFGGLTPGPISNPSLESILAAMYPKESPYWFYLTTKDGDVVYAASNEEHNRNKAKYL